MSTTLLFSYVPTHECNTLMSEETSYLAAPRTEQLDAFGSL